MNKTEAIHKMNELGGLKQPFMFIIDFEMNNIKVLPLNELQQNNIHYSINDKVTSTNNSNTIFNKFPITYNEYIKAFDTVKNEIKKGNSYLTNLTAESKVETGLSLKDIYQKSNAKYKLLYKDEFVVFSPEIFVKIENQKIHSFPMKGTIDATLPDAEELILKNKKEEAEHATIVDLIRNDLSRISTNVKVESYRYIDTIKTHEGKLLQVSSHISGQLEKNFHKQLGSIIFELLPAGSISGAPKAKTIEIIHKAENYDRGYYTGVFGIFDGENIDSAVMIRFIEKQKKGLVFKSGGGITINSNVDDEYDELIKKVYLPF